MMVSRSLSFAACPQRERMGGQRGNGGKSEDICGRALPHKTAELNSDTSCRDQNAPASMGNGRPAHDGSCKQRKAFCGAHVAEPLQVGPLVLGRLPGCLLWLPWLLGPQPNRAPWNRHLKVARLVDDRVGLARRHVGDAPCGQSANREERVRERARNFLRSARASWKCEAESSHAQTASAYNEVQMPQQSTYTLRVNDHLGSRVKHHAKRLAKPTLTATKFLTSIPDFAIRRNERNGLAEGTKETVSASAFVRI
eukprot:6207574-Pleurochrysis_carterae.AAC.1